MTIPRISTKQALDFLNFMDKIFLNDESSKYRIVTDMERYEKDENDGQSKLIQHKKAGATLVHYLRQKGYSNNICIYTGHVKPALKACAELGCTDGIIATKNATECYKFCLNRVDSEPMSEINFEDEKVEDELDEKLYVKDKQIKTQKIQNNEPNIINILQEGWVEKRSKHIGTWRKRWMVIAENKDRIFVYTFKWEKKYKNPTETILISGNHHVQDEMIKNDHTFNLYNKLTRENFIFRASNENDKRSWIDCVHQINVENKSDVDTVNNDNFSQQLLENIGLGKYWALFVNGGYENFENVSTVNEQDLIELGIDNVEDRQKLLMQIQKCCSNK
eukprot:43471_1